MREIYQARGRYRRILLPDAFERSTFQVRSIPDQPAGYRFGIGTGEELKVRSVLDLLSASVSPIGVAEEVFSSCLTTISAARDVFGKPQMALHSPIKTGIPNRLDVSAGLSKISSPPWNRPAQPRRHRLQCHIHEVPRSEADRASHPAQWRGARWRHRCCTTEPAL